MVVINIGGEGEVQGAINVNSLVAPLRREHEIRKAGPLVQADFTQLPIRSGAVDEIVGNRLPFLHGEVARRMCEEAFRVLRPGGVARFEASTGGGAVLVEYLRGAGFRDVRVEVNHALGVRP
jgi:Methyltransferase domain